MPPRLGKRDDPESRAGMRKAVSLSFEYFPVREVNLDRQSKRSLHSHFDFFLPLPKGKLD